MSTALFVALPHLVDGLGDSPPWMAWVRIGIGLLLVVAAVARWMTRSRTAAPPAFLDRLSRITPLGAAGIGVGLVMVNPKILAMNGAAGLLIGTAATGPTMWAAVALYTLLAGSTVIAPILGYVVAGERIDAQLERVRVWMQREHVLLTAVTLLAVGIVLTYSGFRAL
jgi:threonine/homoserine/homoserine lactone efflux protein